MPIDPSSSMRDSLKDTFEQPSVIWWCSNPSLAIDWYDKALLTTAQELSSCRGGQELPPILLVLCGWCLFPLETTCSSWAMKHLDRASAEFDQDSSSEQWALPTVKLMFHCIDVLIQAVFTYGQVSRCCTIYCPVQNAWKLRHWQCVVS